MLALVPQQQVVSQVGWSVVSGPPPIVLGNGTVFNRTTENDSMLTKNTLTLRLALQAAILAGWTAGKLKLFSNDFSPQFDTVVGDFTEATFPGYAAIDDVSGPASGTDAETGLPTVSWMDGSTWLATTIVTPETIFGWYITNTAGSSCLAAGRFDESVTINSDGDVLAISPPKAMILLDTVQ